MKTTRREILAVGAAGLALPARAAGPAWTMPAEGPVERIDVVRIPMADGTRLCGRLWLPADRTRRPAPVVLEYIPYRTRDAYSAADDHWGQVLASHGIAFARIDIRGSGDSEGLLRDEYLAREQDDAVEIIAWLARQPWCSGNVGMRGISWGGFNGLQVAARRPEEGSGAGIAAQAPRSDLAAGNVEGRLARVLDHLRGESAAAVPAPSVPPERWRRARNDRRLTLDIGEETMVARGERPVWYAERPHQDILGLADEAVEIGDACRAGPDSAAGEQGEGQGNGDRKSAHAEQNGGAVLLV